MKKLISSLFVLIFFFSYVQSEQLGVRNPFQKPDVFGLKEKSQLEKEQYQDKVVSLENLRLTGIVNGKIALINHRFVKKGEKLGVFTIKNIEDNNVKLESEGKVYELILNLKKIKNENKETKELKDEN